MNNNKTKSRTDRFMKFFQIFLIFSLCISPAFGGTVDGFVIAWTYKWANGSIRPFAKLVTVNGEILSNAIAISAGDNSSGLAIKSDGRVVEWGMNGEMAKIPADLSDVTALVSGDNCCMALKNNGTVVGWGGKYASKEMNVPAAATNIVSIGIDDRTCVAVRKDGVAVGWGEHPLPSPLDDIAAIGMDSMPMGFNFALKKNGTVVGWNPYDRSSLKIIDGFSNITAIAVGPVHLLGLKKDGTVQAWGRSLHQETQIPVDLSNVVSVAAGGFRNPGMGGFGFSLALKKNGRITAWGVTSENNMPVIVPEGLSNVVAIATSNDNCCLAITTNSAVVEHFLKN